MTTIISRLKLYKISKQLLRFSYYLHHQPSFPVFNLRLAQNKSTPEFIVMSPTSGDSHSPLANVIRSTISVHNDNENIRELQNPVTLPEIDLLGFKNEEEVNGGAPDATTEFITVSSTADDSRSQPADFHGSTISVHTDSENVRELQNPVTLPEIDLLGIGNDMAVNGGATNAMAAEISRLEKTISPDWCGLTGDDKHEVIYNLPPGLSTLNVNGRPRFELVTVRENGRLQMFMVPNRSPQLVRSPGRNGRLKMWLLNDDQHGGERRSLLPVRRSI